MYGIIILHDKKWETGGYDIVYMRVSISLISYLSEELASLIRLSLFENSRGRCLLLRLHNMCVFSRVLKIIPGIDA